MRRSLQNEHCSAPNRFRAFFGRPPGSSLFYRALSGSGQCANRYRGITRGTTRKTRDRGNAVHSPDVRPRNARFWNRIFFRVGLIGLIGSAIIALPYPASIPSMIPEFSRSTHASFRFAIPPGGLEGVDGPVDEVPEKSSFPMPVLLNSSVENYIEYFKTDGRRLLQSWLNRSGQYHPLMKGIFKEKGLPEDLAYLAMIESGYNPHAVSPADATGPWQFIPPTAKRYGLRMDLWVDERKDPVKSTRAAAEHLKDLYNLFGSWPPALASYNAGAPTVQRALLRTQSEGLRSLALSRHLPRETRNYVPKYIAAAIIASDPGKYLFTVPSRGQFEYDEVVVGRSTDLRSIAYYANTTFAEIKRLNPELNREVTPPDVMGYALRLPKGAKQTFLKQISPATTAAFAGNEKGEEEQHEFTIAGSLFSTSEPHPFTGGFPFAANAFKGKNGAQRIKPIIVLDSNGTLVSIGYRLREQAGIKEGVVLNPRRDAAPWKL